MQHRLFYLLFAGFIVMLSCESLDNFSVDSSGKAVIQKGTVFEQLAGNFGFDAFSSFDIKDTSAFSNQDVDANDIDSVRVQQFTLTIEQPANGVDLSFIDKIEFFISADGQTKRRIATAGPFNQGQTSVDMTLDDVELKPYVAQDSMDITTEASGHRPAEDTTIRADLVFDIDVSISGAVCN